jgi:hypothetical protein
LEKQFCNTSIYQNVFETESLMEDPRCCGTGTCIINADGECWCGQRWNGTQMSFPETLHGKTNDAADSPGGSSVDEHSQSGK